MILEFSSASHQQNAFFPIQEEIETRRKRDNTIENYISVQNSPNILLSKNDINNKSANVIKDFFKRTIAAQSYNKMFSNGENFKELAISLPRSSARKAPLSSLQHLDDVSKNYLTRIKEKTQNLTSQEKVLLSKVVDANIHFRHQSNIHLATETGTLNIMSFDKLQAENKLTAKNTYPGDIKYLSNQDFVFFGVEFSDDIAQLPLNTRHSSVDFGAIAYIVNDQFPYGYLTLTDHFDNQVPPPYKSEHKSFTDQFSDIGNEIFRRVHGDKGENDIPIFNTKDMRLGLGLHLIEFLRKNDDTDFKNFALDKNLDSVNLDRILNYVFQPEFHVPRMASTNHFKEVKLREISLEEAVKESNFKVLSIYIKNKDMAGKAMMLAIKKVKQDVVSYLFSKFDFTRNDIIKMSMDDNREAEEVLSGCLSDEKILKDFLDRGLIEPNKPFTKCNSGDTMLDNAIKYNKKEMIAILLAHGAMCGEKLITR